MVFGEGQQTKTAQKILLSGTRFPYPNSSGVAKHKESTPARYQLAETSRLATFFSSVQVSCQPTPDARAAAAVRPHVAGKNNGQRWACETGGCDD